jgi:DNA-binding NarL/FixJ family response regulator
LDKPIVRVLVVDDYEPWRTFITSTLQNKPELQLLAEATDGREAVEIAQQLQPDLILLDIGLPTLNGIEAARRIREVSPASKILFVSENRSSDVAEQALRTGAGGYVVKSSAASELLAAIAAVIEGEQFVSANLTGLYSTHFPRRDKVFDLISRHEGEIPHHHEVGFYSDDRRFLYDVARFIEATLNVGNAAIVVATESHREGLLSELQAHGLDMRAMLEQGRYVALDAYHTLSMFIVNGVIDPGRFLEGFGDLIVAARETTKVENPRVSVFGECVHLLWAKGNAEAAIQFEKLGNKLTQIHHVNILCGYSLGNVEMEMDPNVFQRICAQHSAVYSQ